MNDLDLDTMLGSEPRGRRAARRRRRRQRRGRFLAPLLAFIVLFGIVGGGGYYAYLWLSDALVPKDYTGQGTGEVTVEIKPGETAADVAQTLERLDVVASARAFTNAVTAAGKSDALHPGTYTLRKRMSAANAVAMLDSGNRLRTTVLIKEGLRASDTLATLAKATGKPVKEFQAAAKDAEALGLPQYAKGVEGYLFPATYEFQPQAKPQQILARMVDRFNDAAQEVGLEAGARKLGYTPHQIVIVASIVQAEAGRHEDMPKIARVIYNRLNREPPMKLQMDSTVMYALGKYGTRATHEETKNPSKYNTYYHHGLPAGPIANPGEHALEAALNPAKGDWLWFVATDPKSNVTEFASTEAEFRRLEQKLNQNSQ
ncbi:endolytic transglycosylase MltG [Thermoactinospora rubra]|uniref:endolytic transglycosylase MltG n=1 Tax=Thermoactinospora rubra TaxID=1088767 RepID=UPI000A11C8F0|nr:endolytic transglycosylase MltG [Thermoactinospora rubra]